MSLLTKLFGKKYFIVLARNRFSLKDYMVGHIFKSFADAADFCVGLQYITRSDIGLEVHSFRSRKNLDTYETIKIGRAHV